MLSNEMDILKEIDVGILESGLKEIIELLKKLCGKKKQNFTTGPVIKPVKFDNSLLQQQVPSSFVVVKALNNTSEPQRATVALYNLGILATENKVTKTNDSGLQQAQKVLFFSQAIEVQPQSTVFLPVDITSVDEYEVQVLDASEGMYFATEFIPTTPIPTAQGSTTSAVEQVAGAVIDSHIVTYSHQFEALPIVFL